MAVGRGGPGPRAAPAIADLPVGGSVERAARWLEAEHAMWSGIVRATGVKPHS